MSDFQRLLRLTDAIQHQRKASPADPASFAGDKDLQAKALAVFEAQGITVTAQELRAAVTELDQAKKLAWQQGPIVPLAVQIKPPRRWWRSRAQRESDALRWIRAFQKVRSERYADWSDKFHDARSPSQPNATALSAEHRRLLDQTFPAGGKRVRFIPFVCSMPGPVGGDRNADSPLNHCLLDQFDSYPGCVDLSLGQWVLDQDPTEIQRRLSRKELGSLEYWMKPCKRASLLELLARCGHVDMMAHLTYAWPVPRTWTQSLLWWVLVLPLLDDRKADYERSQEQLACLETTVRFILAHEPKATRHHARVIQEALALHHPHSNWLRQWLASPQEAIA